MVQSNSFFKICHQRRDCKSKQTQKLTWLNNRLSNSMLIFINLFIRINFEKTIKLDELKLIHSTSIDKNYRLTFLLMEFKYYLLQNLGAKLFTNNIAMAAVDITNIACGFSEDCIKLFDVFKTHKSIRFEDFVASWQEMKFSLVFLCRKSYAELLEFSEESLQIAKTFILTSTDFIDRVAGLYLLYGLYNKIPLNDVKIRVTLKEWEFLLQFFDQLKCEQLHDASYIFSKLVTDNAFYHCLFTTEYGLEKSFKTRQEYSFSFENPYSVLPDLVDDVEKGDLGQILRLSEIYSVEKSKLLGSTSKTKLQLFDKNFMDEIIGDIETLQEKRQVFPSLRKKNCKISYLTTKTEKTKYPDNKIRSKLGHGFDTDEESDDEDIDISHTFVQTNRDLPLDINEDLEED